MGDEAMELFHMINPINHARTTDGLERYRTEPFAVAADVYAHPMHVGRGGWTWYTGSAGWMYQAAVRAMLGIRRHGTTMSVAPCIPSVWPEFSLVWTLGRTRYRITVTNPHHRTRGIKSAELDGATVDPRAIPLTDDGAIHDVQIVMGHAGDVLSAAGAPAANRVHPLDGP
jgi:cyclic beta-1,2-glucan synthetase